MFYCSTFNQDKEIITTDTKKVIIIIVRLADELESIGISVKKINNLNDAYELENLIENIKQTWIQDYKTYYDDKKMIVYRFARAEYPLDSI